MDLGALVGTYGVLAIFVVMLMKEIGVPVPIPSDLLMIGAGVQIASGAYSLVPLLATVAAAVLIGSSIQFLLARTAGRAVVYRLAALIGIRTDRIDRMVARLSAGGSRAVFVGLNVPGARAAVIPAAGLARLAFVPFTVATITGSMVFYSWHIALGYLVGPAASTLLDRYATPLVVALGALAAIGLAGWLVIRRRTSGRATLASWTEAACPACLAVTALRRWP